MGSTIVIEPITAADRARFMAIAPGLLNLREDAINIEEVDLHWQVSYATTDVGTASAALEKTITLDLSSANRNKAIQTMDPLLKGDGINAGDQVIGVFAIGARLDQAAAGTLTQARDTLQDLEQTILRSDNANNRRFEIFGETFIHAGTELGTDGNATPGRTIMADVKLRKLGAPFTVGKDQVFKMIHWIGRTTAWGAAFVLDFYAPSLIARKK